MSDSKRIVIVRPHQNVNEYIYQRDNDAQDYSNEQLISRSKDYYAIGWKQLHAIQALSLNDNWPIVLGNCVGSASSGLLG